MKLMILMHTTLTALFFNPSLASCKLSCPIDGEGQENNALLSPILHESPPQITTNHTARIFKMLFARHVTLSAQSDIIQNTNQDDIFEIGKTLPAWKIREITELINEINRLAEYMEAPITKDIIHLAIANVKDLLTTTRAIAIEADTKQKK